MPTNIKCPNCKHEFALGEAEAEEYKKELQVKMTAYVKQKDEEFKRKEDDFEKQKLQIQAAALKKGAEDMIVKLKSLEEESQQKTLQLQDMQKKELQLLRERNELEQRTKNMDMEIEKRLLEDRKKIEMETSQREQQLFDLKLKDKDIQLEGLKTTIEELRRKSEQGSMQTQGESQELLLEGILREHFPFDIIEEVGKGIEGADCIQVIRNSTGKECGRIIYESKRTKGWNNSWINKLKNDMRSKNIGVAILVSQTFPKDMTGFGYRDGIWICSFAELKGLSAALRDGVIKVYEAQISQENKGEKMQMLYDYLTSIEFRQRMEAIVEAYNNLEKQIIDEKKFMQKKWEERRKLTDKVLGNTIGLYGSIKGIAGASFGDIPLLESSDDNNSEMPLNYSPTTAPNDQKSDNE